MSIQFGIQELSITVLTQTIVGIGLDSRLAPDDARGAFEGLADVYARHGSVPSALSDAAGSDEKVETAYHQGA